MLLLQMERSHIASIPRALVSFGQDDESSEEESVNGSLDGHSAETSGAMSQTRLLLMMTMMEFLLTTISKLSTKRI